MTTREFRGNQHVPDPKGGASTSARKASLTSRVRELRGQADTVADVDGTAYADMVIHDGRQSAEAIADCVLGETAELTGGDPRHTVPSWSNEEQAAALAQIREIKALYATIEETLAARVASDTEVAREPEAVQFIDHEAESRRTDPKTQALQKHPRDIGRAMMGF